MPPLILLLSACETRQQAPQPIPALAEQHQCPAYPLPPAGLLKTPEKTDADSDRELAIEQATQPDQLIKWIKAQVAVDPNNQPD